MPHAENTGKLPRILFIDAYDSFSNNIVALVKELLSADVQIIHIDDERYLRKDGQAFRAYLKEFDAVIAGPGPGSPDVHADLGLIEQLWTLEVENLLPVLGICLGFQSLALACGARIERLVEPRHGIIAEIHHNKDPLFADSDQILVTQYNSLTARIHTPALGIGLKPDDEALWQPSKSCPTLQPLAWTCDDVENGPVLQAVKHIHKPFWAVQYHPESICTNEGGARIIENWWTEAMKWRLGHKKTSLARQGSARSLNRIHDTSIRRPAVVTSSLMSKPLGLDQVDTLVRSTVVKWNLMPLNNMTIAAIAEALHIVSGNVAILESATREDHVPVNAETGRFSILGCFAPGETERIEYYSPKRLIHHMYADKQSCTRHDCPDFWVYLKEYMQSRKASHGSPDSPFWGGLVGFVSYEACLQTINVPPSAKSEARPDACFLLVQRSVVIDHASGQVYIQSICPDDESWIDQARSVLDAISFNLQTAASSNAPMTSPTVDRVSGSQKQATAATKDNDLEKQLGKVRTRMPKRGDYCQKVRECQEAIRSGNSYELCLTDQTQVLLPSLVTHAPHNDWNLYQRLRQRNPAPYSSFLRLECSTEILSIISSSPERFLGWTRPSLTAASTCQFRPIKGTVRKTPSTTRTDAETILNSSKERAENLMIVDLIRHDLYGVVGPGNVRVEKLMQVEEYETVFQLVSVIEGRLPCEGDVAGIDVLAASLPPGSMTGAPKRRSCEILQSVEGGRHRGVYSGVLGYLDVGGGGDFSVVIRTASRWSGDVEGCEDGECEGVKSWDVWTIGAGGAVTSQSTDVGEWEEMETKRDALLNAFRVTP